MWVWVCVTTSYIPFHPTSASTEEEGLGTETKTDNHKRRIVVVLVVPRFQHGSLIGEELLRLRLLLVCRHKYIYICISIGLFSLCPPSPSFCYAHSLTHLHLCLNSRGKFPSSVSFNFSPTMGASASQDGVEVIATQAETGTWALLRCRSQDLEEISVFEHVFEKNDKVVSLLDNGLKVKQKFSFFKSIPAPSPLFICMNAISLFLRLYRI